MTNPADPFRSTPPTVREIAELTARLRNLTGHDVDEREQVAFLADKHALLARIAAQGPADSERRRNPWAVTADPDAVAHTHSALHNRAEWEAGTEGARADDPWWAQAHSTHADTAAVTFDASGYYSDAAIAAIADAQAAGDTAHAQLHQDRPWLAQGATVDTAHVQVRDDDAAELAARAEALHEQITAPDPGPGSGWQGERPTGRPPCCVVIDTEQQDARREQLARWHTDDTTTRADTDVDTAGDVEARADGRVWGETDGSGPT